MIRLKVYHIIYLQQIIEVKKMQTFAEKLISHLSVRIQWESRKASIDFPRTDGKAKHWHKEKVRKGKRKRMKNVDKQQKPNGSNLNLRKWTGTKNKSWTYFSNHSKIAYFFFTSDCRFFLPLIPSLLQIGSKNWIGIRFFLAIINKWEDSLIQLNSVLTNSVITNNRF